MGREDVLKEDKKGTEKKFKKRIKDKKEVSNKKKYGKKEIAEAKDLSKELLKLKDYINTHYHSS